MLQFCIFFLLGLLLAYEASSTEAPGLDFNEVMVKQNGRDIVVGTRRQGLKTLYPQFDVWSQGRVEIRIPAEPAAGPKSEKAVGTPSLADKVKARRLLAGANQAFFSGDLSKAWQLIDEAEALNADDYMILSMKGSLLYKTGSKDLAVELWKKSLSTNPNQPDIAVLLKQFEAEKTGSKPPAASVY